MVVIELKAGTADRDALGQILAYMGDLMTTERSVRGILIAGDFTARAIAAARAARNVQLIRYGIRFSFSPVSPETISA
jgi:RecB family endonuclease NucS